MSLNGDTGSSGSDGATPIDDLVHAVGSTAAQGAIDTVAPQLGDLSSDAGASFTIGALDQLSSTAQPYVPFVLIGLALLFLMRR